MCARKRDKQNVEQRRRYREDAEYRERLRAAGRNYRSRLKVEQPDKWRALTEYSKTYSMTLYRTSPSYRARKQATMRRYARRMKLLSK